MNAAQLRKRYGHACTLEKKELFDEPLGFESRTLLKSSLHCCSISESNKRFSHYCRSQYRLRQEKIYHFKKHPLKIHPLSSFRIAWESFMILISITILLIVPMNQTFSLLPLQDPSHLGWDYYFKFVLNIICFIDILLNFQTGYYDSKCNIVFECSKIALRYFKTRFFCDFLSSIPNVQPNYDALAYEDYTLYSIDHIIILLKTLRLASLIRYTRNVGESFGMNNITIELIQMFQTMVVIVHWTACIVIVFGTIGIGLLRHEEPMEESWLEMNNVYNSSLGLVYITSLYRAACFLTSADYALGIDYNAWDIVMKTVCWLLSKILFGFCIGFTIQIARSSNSPTILFRRKLQKMLQYADQKQINLRTTKRIIAFYEFKFRNKFFKEKDILRNISPKLRSDLLMFNRLKLLKRIEFFKGLPETLLSYIGACLRQQFYLTGDVIVNANQKGDGLYLILTGTVVFYTASGIEYCHMHDGQYFGEIELILSEQKTICTVIALEASELYFLSNNDFHEAIAFVKQFPEILQRLQQHIDKRVMRVQNIEARYIQMQNERTAELVRDESDLALGEEQGGYFREKPANFWNKIHENLSVMFKEKKEKRVQESDEKLSITTIQSPIPEQTSDTSAAVSSMKQMPKEVDMFTERKDEILELARAKTFDEISKKRTETRMSMKITEPETNVKILTEAVVKDPSPEISKSDVKADKSNLEEDVGISIQSEKRSSTLSTRSIEEGDRKDKKGKGKKKSEK